MAVLSAAITIGDGIQFSPLGRLLHDPPWRLTAAERSPSAPLAPGMPHFPQPPNAAARKYDGMSPAEAEAQRAVDRLVERFEEWKERGQDSFLLLPMPLVVAALELGARSDVALITVSAAARIRVRFCQPHPQCMGRPRSGGGVGDIILLERWIEDFFQMP